MPAAYNLIKFLHVAAVTVWVGGVVALSVINARLSTAAEPTARLAMIRESQAYGKLIIAPAMGVVLLAGFAMVGIAHLHPGMLWIWWGLIGLVASVVVAGPVMGRAGAELGRLAGSPDGPRVGVLQRRLRWLAILNMLLLFSVIWAMVYKPTL